MQKIVLNVKSFSLFRSLVETKGKLFPLVLRKLLRISLQLSIFIFVSLALWYHLSLVQSTVKIFGLWLGNGFFLLFSFGTIQLLRSHKLGGFLTPPLLPPCLHLFAF